jgi:glycosyltransferase involved in cell wall biosynthesis
MITHLSAVVITHNSAAKLAPCLDSLREVTHDIVVVDSGSTDATRQICLDRHVRFYERAWTGYSDQKNYGNALAKHDWILSLDADERLSPELIESIREAFAQPLAVEAFDLRFRTHFAAKPIRFGGWNPESHVRLFDKRLIEWNSDAVHEGLTLRPEHQIGRLTGYVHHFTVDTPAELKAKTDRYSALYGQRAAQAGKQASWVKVWGSPVFRFLVDYVLKLGFLDGAAGWLIARESARYTHLKYRYLLALTQQQAEADFVPDSEYAASLAELTA